MNFLATSGCLVVSLSMWNAYTLEPTVVQHGCPVAKLGLSFPLWQHQSSNGGNWGKGTNWRLVSSYSLPPKHTFRVNSVNMSIDNSKPRFQIAAFLKSNMAYVKRKVQLAQYLKMLTTYYCTVSACITKCTTGLLCSPTNGATITIKGSLYKCTSMFAAAKGCQHWYKCKKT